MSLCMTAGFNTNVNVLHYGTFSRSFTVLLQIELIYYNVLLCINPVLHCACMILVFISVRVQLNMHQG